MLLEYTIDYEVRSDKTTRRISLEAFSEVLNHGFRQSKTDSTQLLQLLYAKWISDVSCGFCKLNITLVHIRWHQDPSHFGTMLYTLYYQVKYSNIKTVKWTLKNIVICVFFRETSFWCSFFLLIPIVSLQSKWNIG